MQNVAFELSERATDTAAAAAAASTAANKVETERNSTPAIVYQSN